MREADPTSRTALSARGRPARRGPAHLFVLAALVALAVASLAGPIASASAHAQLTSASPQRDAVLDKPPRQVTFTFSEAVTGTGGAVRVYGPDGRRVDAGGAFHPAGRQDAYAVELTTGLAEGTYTATYQVVSADGHVVSAGSTFSIGRPSVPEATVSSLLARQEPGPVTRAALTAARGVQFAAIAVGAGVLAFLVLIWPPAWRRAGGATRMPGRNPAESMFARRSRAITVAAAAAGALSAVLAVGLNAAELSGESLFEAVRGEALSTTLGSRFGAVWATAAVLWVLVGAGATALIRPERPLPGRAAALLVPAFALLLVPGLGGHAGSVGPELVVLPANFIHVLAATVWVGGIAALLLAVRPAAKTMEGPARNRALVEVVGAFSAVALAAVVALAISGVVQAAALMGSPADLWESGYGRLVLVKTFLLLALAAIGALHRRRSLPALRADAGGNAGRGMRDLLLADAGLLVAVFAATAILSGTPPPTGTNAGPENLTGQLGPARYEAAVDPSARGPNTIHLYLFDPRTGAQWDRADRVKFSVLQPELGIGPLTQAATKAGPGHFLAQGVQLAAPGRWTIRFEVRAGEFDQYTTDASVTVR
jgi:copper transport protein